jgi:hypothetical protein
VSKSSLQHGQHQLFTSPASPSHFWNRVLGKPVDLKRLLAILAQPMEGAR